MTVVPDREAERLGCECEVCELATELAEERLLHQQTQERVVALEQAAQELRLWEPGKRGYAAAHSRFFAVVDE